MNQTKSNKNIHVLARVRPFLQNEDETIGFTINDKKNQITIRQKAFEFDSIAGSSSTQQNIFNTVGKPVCDSAINGYNGTIFAYGQTGSGKTYTIKGLLDHVFTYIPAQLPHGDNIEFELKYSAYEIYNEKITDLQNPSQQLTVRQNQKGQFILWPNLTHKICKHPNELIDLANIALSGRTTRKTLQNNASSRSHAICTVHIERRMLNIDATVTVRRSMINIVDLAGSEKYELTQSKRQEKECKNINKSLHTLSKVIAALSAAGKGPLIPPYRDSVLTKLLKESICGRSICWVIGNISPSVRNINDSVETLKFLKRAKNIKVIAKPERNQEEKGNIAILKASNCKLISKIQQLQLQNQQQGNENLLLRELQKEQQQKQQQQNNEIQQLQCKNQEIEQENISLKQSNFILETQINLQPVLASHYSHNNNYDNDEKQSVSPISIYDNISNSNNNEVNYNGTESEDEDEDDNEFIDYCCSNLSTISDEHFIKLFEEKYKCLLDKKQRKKARKERDHRLSDHIEKYPPIECALERSNTFSVFQPRIATLWKEIRKEKQELFVDIILERCNLNKISAALLMYLIVDCENVLKLKPMRMEELKTIRKREMLQITQMAYDDKQNLFAQHRNRYEILLDARCDEAEKKQFVEERLKKDWLKILQEKRKSDKQITDDWDKKNRNFYNL